MIVAYVPDLADRSRIDAALPDVTFVKSPDDLAASDADIVIIDLSRSPELPAMSGKRVVGFGSHVDDQLLARAGAAGIEAMPRSRFFRDIAGLFS